MAVRAQELSALTKSFEWGGEPVWSSAWDDPSSATEVLEDVLEVRLKNVKPRFLALFFERRKVIRFTSEADILEFASFALPESLDPPYDGRWKAGRGSQGPPRPEWFNVRLDHFAARIVRPDGSWGEVGAFGHVERDQVRTFRTMETAWTYVLDLQAIAPGDVVEVRWKYMVPYDVNGGRTDGWRGYEWMDNWARLTSWRVFFHGDLPIRRQRVTFKYHTKHGLGLWSEEPHELSEDGDVRTATWRMADLAACMSEVNARPGVDLPHIRVKLHADDTRYWTRDRLSGMPYIQPYWLYVLRVREQRALWWVRVARKNVSDKQNKMFNTFVDATVAGLPIDRPHLRMRELHNTIAERFSYVEDSLWYMDLDQGLPRFGDQVTDGRIREIGRYDLYAKLTNAVKAGYSTAYLMDRRIGVMDDRWMTPLWDSDLVFGVKAPQGVMWMHPKRGASGEWADELPFYWQGSRAMLMDPFRLIADGLEIPLFVDLPLTIKGSDLRVREFTLDVDVANGTVRGDQHALLSGQFSTLGRGAYLGRAMDPSVLAAYGVVPLDPRGATTEPWTIHSSSTEAPFRFTADRRIELDRALQTQEDTTWTLDLSGMLAHAVPQNFRSADRDLPFYWDFEQNDRAVIDIRFDRPMEFDGLETLDEIVVTPTARYERRIVAHDPMHIRLESTLRVTAIREEARDASAFEHLLNAAGGSGILLQGRPVTGRE